MMLLAKLYTEMRDNLPYLVARHFSGATLYSAIGLYGGMQEHATIIEIVDDDTPGVRASVTALAQDICSANEQHCVLVVLQSADGRLDRYDVTAPALAPLQTRHTLETETVF